MALYFFLGLLAIRETLQSSTESSGLLYVNGKLAELLVSERADLPHESASFIQRHASSPTLHDLHNEDNRREGDSENNTLTSSTSDTNGVQSAMQKLLEQEGEQTAMISKLLEENHEMMQKMQDYEKQLNDTRKELIDTKTLAVNAEHDSREAKDFADNAMDNAAASAHDAQESAHDAQESADAAKTAQKGKAHESDFAFRLPGASWLWTDTAADNKGVDSVQETATSTVASAPTNISSDTDVHLNSSEADRLPNSSLQTMTTAAQTVDPAIQAPENSTHAESSVTTDASVPSPNPPGKAQAAAAAAQTAAAAAQTAAAAAASAAESAREEQSQDKSISKEQAEVSLAESAQSEASSDAQPAQSQVLVAAQAAGMAEAARATPDTQLTAAATPTPTAATLELTHMSPVMQPSSTEHAQEAAVAAESAAVAAQTAAAAAASAMKSAREEQTQEKASAEHVASVAQSGRMLASELAVVAVQPAETLATESPASQSSRTGHAQAAAAAAESAAVAAQTAAAAAASAVKSAREEQTQESANAEQAVSVSQSAQLPASEPAIVAVQPAETSTEATQALTQAQEQRAVFASPVSQAPQTGHAQAAAAAAETAAAAAQTAAAAAASAAQSAREEQAQGQVKSAEQATAPVVQVGQIPNSKSPLALSNGPAAESVATQARPAAPVVVATQADASGKVDMATKSQNVVTREPDLHMLPAGHAHAAAVTMEEAPAVVHSAAEAASSMQSSRSRQAQENVVSAAITEAQVVKAAMHLSKPSQLAKADAPKAAPTTQLEKGVQINQIEKITADTQEGTRHASASPTGHAQAAAAAAETAAAAAQTAAAAAASAAQSAREEQAEEKAIIAEVSAPPVAEAVQTHAPPARQPGDEVVGKQQLDMVAVTPSASKQMPASEYRQAGMSTAETVVAAAHTAAEAAASIARTVHGQQQQEAVFAAAKLAAPPTAQVMQPGEVTPVTADMPGAPRVVANALGQSDAAAPQTAALAVHALPSERITAAAELEGATVPTQKVTTIGEEQTTATHQKSATAQPHASKRAQAAAAKAAAAAQTAADAAASAAHSAAAAAAAPNPASGA